MLNDTLRRPGRAVRRVIFTGPDHCNVCGNHVRFFSITGRLGRTLGKHQYPYTLDDFETLNHRRYLCPVCISADRERLYKLYFDRFVPPDRVRRVLDFAPSRALGEYLRGRADLRYRSADIAMKNADDKVDITDMPIYADASFDFFICSHVLEHVADDAKAISELFRISSPGAQGIVMTPVAPEGSFDEDPTVTDTNERWRRFAQGDHVRLYDRSTLCSRLRAGGFDVQLLDVETFGAEVFERHGIGHSSVLYIVSKPTAD